MHERDRLPAEPAKSGSKPAGAPSAAVLRLQQAAGNRAVAMLARDAKAPGAKAVGKQAPGRKAPKAPAKKPPAKQAAPKPTAPYINIEGIGVIAIKPGDVNFDEIVRRESPKGMSRHREVEAHRRAPTELTIRIPMAAQAEKLIALYEETVILGKNDKNLPSAILTAPPMHGSPAPLEIPIYGLMITRAEFTNDGKAVTFGLTWEDIRMPTWWFDPWWEEPQDHEAIESPAK